jgi:hypothetical protein
MMKPGAFVLNAGPFDHASGPVQTLNFGRITGSTIFNGRFEVQLWIVILLISALANNRKGLPIVRRLRQVVGS